MFFTICIFCVHLTSSTSICRLRGYNSQDSILEGITFLCPQYKSICSNIFVSGWMRKQGKLAFLSVCPQQRLWVCGDRSKSQHMTQGRRRRRRDTLKSHAEIKLAHAFEWYFNLVECCNLLQCWPAWHEQMNQVLLTFRLLCCFFKCWANTCILCRQKKAHDEEFINYCTSQSQTFTSNTKL